MIEGDLAGRRRGRRIGLVAAAVAMVAVITAIVYRPLFLGNFGVVAPGLVYRCAQPEGNLGDLITTYRPASILNLRGGSYDDDWYLAELGAAAHLGIDFYDFLMRPDRRPSRRELLTLIDLFDRCRYPLLIHCKSGADRTGLASALYRMTRGGESPEEALGAFSVAYGHMPIGGPERLHEPIEEYRAWLRAEGRPHEPRRFRDWVARHYRDERPGDSGPIEPLEPGTRLSPPPPLRAVSIGEAP